MQLYVGITNLAQEQPDTCLPSPQSYWIMEVRRDGRDTSKFTIWWVQLDATILLNYLLTIYLRITKELRYFS